MQIKKILLMAGVLITFNFMANAQSDTPQKPYVMQTLYLNASMVTPHLNLDSILKVYKQHFIDPNNYVAGSKIITHWWGHDSREVIIMYELKDLDDLDKAFKKQRDLQEAYRKDHPDYVEQIRALFAGSHHADEIYRVVAE